MLCAPSEGLRVWSRTRCLGVRWGRSPNQQLALHINCLCAGTQPLRDADCSPLKRRVRLNGSLGHPNLCLPRSCGSRRERAEFCLCQAPRGARSALPRRDHLTFHAFITKPAQLTDFTCFSPVLETTQDGMRGSVDSLILLHSVSFQHCHNPLPGP